MLRVARQCGFPTLRHFEARYGDMTSREVVELVAAERLDPPIGLRLDFLVSMLCAVVVNTTPRKKGAQAAKPAEFMPKWGGEQKKIPRTKDEIAAVEKQVRSVMEAFRKD